MDSIGFIEAFGRRLRIAFIGGGQGSGIGDVHRIASRIDDIYETVAGVYSSDARRSRAFAATLGLAPDRAYASWQELIERERQISGGADVIAIMTPNDSHYDIASAALEAGFDVLCDKPLTTSLNSSRELMKICDREGRALAVSYCYTGFPMVRQARAMVADGVLGMIRQVHVQYVQGWAAEGKLPGWRQDPTKVGGPSVLIDIGTHAYHLASFVTDSTASKIFADIGHTSSVLPADDYVAMLLHFAGGARGSIWATTAASGAEHGLMFRIHGDKGGLEWHEEQPNSLIHCPKGDFARTLTRRKSDIMTEAALRVTRTEIGHPEGYLEAFATIYSDLAWSIARRERGLSFGTPGPDYPDARQGAEGLAMVEAATKSAREGVWTDVEEVSSWRAT